MSRRWFWKMLWWRNFWSDGGICRPYQLQEDDPYFEIGGEG